MGGSDERRMPEATGANPAPSLPAELAQLIIGAAPVILYVYDAQKQKSVFQNRPFSELLGHPHAPDPALSEWQRFIHPDDAARFPAHREKLKAIASGETLFWEFRMRAADGTWRWFMSRDSLLSTDARGKPLLVVGTSTDITEQKKAEHDKELLAGELRHRAKNLVAVVEAIGRQSRPKDSPQAEAFVDSFIGRLVTLLNTGEVVLSSDSRTPDLRMVVEMALGPFNDAAAPERIAFDGPAVSVSERTAGGLALALHELATNAFKYGSLSVPEGRIRIRWQLAPAEEGRLFALEWEETGGPPVSKPGKEGFGARVIRYSIAHEKASKVSTEYRPEGLRCRFEYRIG